MAARERIKEILTGFIFGAAREALGKLFWQTEERRKIMFKARKCKEGSRSLEVKATTAVPLSLLSTPIWLKSTLRARPSASRST